jgi:hypothetical protein
MINLSDSLEHFKFIGGHTHIPDIPLSKLKHLELVLTFRCPPWWLLQKLIERNELKTLIITLPTLPPMQASQVSIPAPILMRSLRELRLDIRSAWQVFMFLAALRLPCLTSLSLAGFHQPMNEVLDEIRPIEVLQNLEQLTLSHCHFIEEGLLVHLSKMSKLTHLELSHTGSRTNRIVDALAESTGPDSEWMCPSLTHLNLTSGISSAEPCIRLVRNRNRSTDGDMKIVPLEYLNMDQCADLDPALLRYLETKVPYFTAKPPRPIKQRRR